MYFLYTMIAACLISCSKAGGSQSIAEKPSRVDIIQNGKSIELGTGSGDLIIDGSDEILKDKRLILIKGGIYGHVFIRNLKGTSDEPIAIKNLGQVSIRGVMDIDNVSHVLVAGDHEHNLQYGFIFQNIPYRAITLIGELSGLTLTNMSFKDVKDYVIFIEASKGRRARKEQLKILNSKFENAGGIQYVSHLESDGDQEFLNGFEFANNIVKNTSAGNFVYIENVQDYDIHHNTVDNVNSNNDEHNGVFHMIGNGKFHSNKVTNYQGNMLRAWAFSRGNSTSTIEIYNNIGYNSRKYGAFEIQGFDRYIISGKTTIANAKVHNNTVGKMNTSKDWEGVILDLYSYGGTLEYYNNLGFDLNYSKPITDMINNMSDTKIIKNVNNKYFNSVSEAVIDLRSFVSKHSGVGSNL